MPRHPRQNLGRPLRLNAVIAERDGEPVTLRQAILRYLEDGIPFDTSIALVGTHRATVNAWLRDAARAQERVTINPEARLTHNERDLVVFARQVETAIATAERKHWDIMRQLSEGGLTRRRVMIKSETVNGQQVEVERTTTAETTLPSFNATRWILEERFERRKPIDVRIEEGALTDSEAATELADAMERWLSTHDADERAPADANGKANGQAPQP